MKVLNNLLKINGQCVYQNYGAFLVEERQGDLSNYEELLRRVAEPARHEALHVGEFPRGRW